MFGNMKNLGAMAGLLQRKDEIADAAKALAERMGDLRVEGQAGGGICRAWVTGKLKVDRIEYDPALLGAVGASPEAKMQLERLTAEAVNDAVENCQRVMQDMVAEEARRLGIEDLIPKGAGGGGPFGGLLGGSTGS